MNIKLLFVIIFLPLLSIVQEVIISGEALYNTNFTLINGAIMGATIKNSKSSKANKTSTKTKLKDLSFVRSESLSKQIQQDFIFNLSKSQPEVKPSLTKVFSDNKLRNQFDNLLKSYNYSSTDLADVLTAYLVISWQVVNDKSFEDKRGFHAVRDFVRNVLLQNEALSKMDNTKKQLIAETYSYQTMLCFNAYKQLNASRDSKGLENLRSRVHTSVNESFVDLKTIRLTDKGFVKK